MGWKKRLVAFAAAGALLPSSMLLGGGTASGQASVGASTQVRTAGPTWESGPVDPAHPFSQPVHYPLRQYMRMDCYKANPGAQCAGRNYHKDWAMTLSTTSITAPGNNAVMAMGAGRMRIKRVGKNCGSSSVAEMGTTVEIDHGAGWVSRYGHLSNADLPRYRAKHGRLVAAGERIGTMGNTGSVRCGPPYLNLQVERYGVRLQMRTLSACMSGRAEQWPRDQFTSSPRYRTWNQVHEDDELASRGVPFSRRSFFPRLRPGDRLAFLDPSRAPDNSCFSPTAPATPEKPAAPRVQKLGSRQVRVSWGRLPAGVRPHVLVAHFHRGQRTWKTLKAVDAAPQARSVRIKGLRKGDRHRVAFSVGNGVGWSAPSRAVNVRAGR